MNTLLISYFNLKVSHDFLDFYKKQILAIFKQHLVKSKDIIKKFILR